MTKKYVMPAWTGADSPQTPVPVDDLPYEVWVVSPLECCDHCEHDVNDPPHDVPCPEGCNQ